mgnify:CR=1 FL=1
MSIGLELAIRHANQFKCPFCLKKFPSLPQLRRHVRHDHKDITTCPICRQTFPNNIRLKYHIGRMANCDVEEIANAHKILGYLICRRSAPNFREVYWSFAQTLSPEDYYNYTWWWAKCL